jgi:hypothetical protein
MVVEDWIAFKPQYLLPVLSCFTLMTSAAAYFIRKRRTLFLEDYPFAPYKFPIIGEYQKKTLRDYYTRD